MSKITPVRKAYRNCGFHNRTLAELRKDSTLLRSAIFASNNPDSASIPNVFGAFEHNGVKYHTVLTLIGIKDMESSSNGMTWLNFKEINKNKIMLEFFILINKKLCSEDVFAKIKTESDLDNYCMSIAERNVTFATEFLCCYKFFYETVKEIYYSGNCSVVDIPTRNMKELHPQKDEIDNLLCCYENISEMLEDFEKKHKTSFNDINEFLGKHLGRSRKYLLSYYSDWIRTYRIPTELVEAKTIEFIAMRHLNHNYIH